MIRHSSVLALGFFLATLIGGSTSTTSAAEPGQEFDIVIYGGTSAGVTAAVQSRKLGKTVVLIEPGKHIGGLTSGGLGATDFGRKEVIGGLSREFYGRILRYYQNKDAWRQEEFKDYIGRARHYIEPDAMLGFEPHVAEQIFREMLHEVRAAVVYSQRLNRRDGVVKENGRIISIEMETGEIYRGKMFLDATYEGDLLAAAGVSYTVGREANSQYEETLNGVQVDNAKKHQFNFPVDPYIEPGNPQSGLLPYIHDGSPGEQGEADKRVQAYNFRMCLTNDPDNRVPFPKPAEYDEKDYELLLRYFEAGLDILPWHNGAMPNRKTDTNNNGAFSTDFIGMNNHWPEGSYEEREAMFEAHKHYQMGLMWTVCNHPRVPETIRNAASQWGLARDEFIDHGNWPHTLYVREGRRMVSDFVVTENHLLRKIPSPRPIGMGSYNMDSHNVQRYVDENGHARNEGDVQVSPRGPYPIDYGALIPKKSECENLLVPVCVSCTHIAYGSIRMEPVFMILGQSAATAACIAIDQKIAVQDVDYNELRLDLIAGKQVLAISPAPGFGGEKRQLEGVVIDNDQARQLGNWLPGSVTRRFIGNDYLHDNDRLKGEMAVTYQAVLKETGKYEVRMSYSSHENRAQRVPVTIQHGHGESTVAVNQRIPPQIDGVFTSLGVFLFTSDRPAVVIIRNGATNGHVVADAVQFIKVE